MIGDLDFLFVLLGEAPSRLYNTTNICEIYEMKQNKMKCSLQGTTIYNTYYVLRTFV